MTENRKKGQAGITQPSPAQTLAIEHASGPIQVLAGPGSGKTYLTIRRIRHLICHHGISPDKILVITFTKAAAMEMEERFHKLTEGSCQGVHFGTFHAVYFHILKRSAYGKGRLTLASTQEKWNCLRHILNMHHLEYEHISYEHISYEHISYVEKSMERELFGALLKEISKWKNSGMTDVLPKQKENWNTGAGCVEDEKLQQLFPVIFKEYCELMQEAGKLDFDDMIFLCQRMFAEKKEILAYWQRAFSHILVDEFQDISPLQYQVLKQLAAPQNNLFIVGDDDQSIYGFRGAGPDIMKQFLQDYPNALQLTLDTNYRSAGNIVEASQLLICENQNRFAKQIRAHSLENGSVVVRAFQEKEVEERHLIHALKQMSPQEREQTAVICRTNAQLARLSRPLVQENIPFYSRERMDNLFSHDIAKDFLAYLQYSHDIYANPDSSAGNRKDFLRIMNKPCRYIQRFAVGEGACSKQALQNFYRQKPYMQDCMEHFFADLKKIAALRPYPAIDYIRKIIGYDTYLCENKKREEQKEQMEIADEIQKTTAKYRTLEEWLHYIAVYSDRLEENRQEKRKTDNGIQLITMHSAKGLEYDTVFLPQINAKLLPGRKADTKEAMEEERRIFYVAMTRAKVRLEISYFQDPSPFLTKWMDSPCVDKK